MQEYRHKVTPVSLINYHFVWCPKYRRQVLGDAVKTWLEMLIGEVAVDLDHQILALEVMAYHVYLFLSCPPTLPPCQITFHVKDRSSRKLRQEIPPLRRPSYLWTRFYLVGMEGNVSADTIRHYITMQNQRERA